jgi:tetratricopeptide (TPR) repeat protein
MSQNTSLKNLLDAAQLENRLREAARRNPRDAEANYALARHLAETKRGAEALPFAELACKLSPQNFHYLYYCGALYRDFHQYEYALGLLRESVRIEPRVFLSNYDLASCYHRLGNGEKALSHFRAALKLAGDSWDRYRARIGLADCLAASGEIEPALRLYESARKDRPADTPPDAECRIATLKKVGPQSQEADTLRTLLDHAATPDKDRENILLALGNIHDRAREHDEAFAYWSASRALVKERLRSLGINLSRDHAVDYLERSKFYTPEMIHAVMPLGHDSESPVFIAGMPRSGTTLTEQILGSHPDAFPVGEISRWLQIEAAFHADYGTDDRIARLTENAAKGELKARAEEHLVLMRLIANRNASRFIEKTTQTYQWLGYLATCFPKARFLHLIRHPADSFISTYQNQFTDSFPYAFDQVAYAKEYAFSLRMMAYWKAVYGAQIDTYFYEDLTDDTEAVARRMVSFIGLPWNDSCLSFHKSRNVVRTFSAQQVKKPIYRTSIDKWRVYEKHLKRLLDELERQGVTYAPGHVTVAPLTP